MKPVMSKAEMIEWSPELAKDFTNLNLAWVRKYFYVEPADEEILGNPQAYIIDKGGFIFFAKVGSEIAGTFALLKNNETEFELAKMAVAQKFQGNKIGNKMLEFFLEKARQL